MRLTFPPALLAGNIASQAPITDRFDMVEMLRVRTVVTGVAGSPCYTNLYFGPGATAPEAQSAVIDFWSDYTPISAGGADFNIEGTILRVESTTGEIQGAEVLDDEHLGSEFTLEIGPPGTQGLIAWKTGSYLNGRSVGGRTFIPAVAETQNNLGAPNSTFQTVLASMVQTLLLSPAGQYFGIYSRPVYTRIGVPVLQRPGAFSVVATGSPLNQWSSLRTRRTQG